MPFQGRKSKLGALQGPQNEENINGTHPVFCTCLQSNSDGQLPYRLPICAATHSDLCSDDCIRRDDSKEVLEAAQYSQDAQVGYACDYQNKRAARCCNEVKECVKGHRTLQSNVEGRSTAYIAKRHVMRLCSDAYGKGVVRSNQESINLRAYAKEHDALAAETFRTASTVSFPRRDLRNGQEAVFHNR